MASGIYTITAPSGGQYVGSAVCLTDRLCDHRRQLQRGIHPNRPLQRAFVKYEGRLIFRKLLICSKEMLLFFEQRAIDILSPKYNICRIAGSGLGTKRSDQQRANMSAGMLGVKHLPRTEEDKQKISQTLKNRERHPNSMASIYRIGHAPRTLVQLEALRKYNACRGAMSAEMKAKISAATIVGMAAVGYGKSMSKEAIRARRRRATMKQPPANMRS